jgi:flagellar basal-body rod modification protein FlgD
MAIEAIAATQQDTAASTQQTMIGQDDLFQILLTQLNYQDPLKPMDNQEFIAQLAQFTTLEQTRQQGEKLDNLLSMLSTNQAVSMLGKVVQVQLEQTTEAGSVIGIDFDKGVPQLTVRASSGEVFNQVKLSQLLAITNP